MFLLETALNFGGATADTVEQELLPFNIPTGEPNQLSINDRTCWDEGSSPVMVNLHVKMVTVTLPLSKA